MADLLHANTIQQLEVALLCLPASQVVNPLASGWVQTKPILMTMLTQPHPQAYTSSLPAPAPTSSLC